MKLWGEINGFPASWANIDIQRPRRSRMLVNWWSLSWARRSARIQAREGEWVELLASLTTSSKPFDLLVQWCPDGSGGELYELRLVGCRLRKATAKDSSVVVDMVGVLHMVDGEECVLIDVPARPQAARNTKKRSLRKRSAKHS